MAQDIVRVGVVCWVLHPGCGTKPVAEGIAGGAAGTNNTAEGTVRSFLEELCDDGQQRVTLTKMYRKNTDLLIPDNNARSKYLDDYVYPPAPSGTCVTWYSRYLIPKSET
jgi:hypothetical protein